MDVDDFLDGCPVRVHDGTYAVVKSRVPDPDAFATIDDGAETTVVAESDAYDPDDAIAVEDGWRVLTFDVVLPFDLVGFLARVTAELADAGVPVFALSAYSTDHVLVKTDDLDAAVDRLSALGCVVDHEAGDGGV